MFEDALPAVQQQLCVRLSALALVQSFYLRMGGTLVAVVADASRRASIATYVPNFLPHTLGLGGLWTYSSSWSRSTGEHQRNG